MLGLRTALTTYRQVSNIRHLNRQLNCRSLRCSWSIACRRCTNCIFILDLTPGFKALGKYNFKARWESYTFRNLVRLILDIYGNDNINNGSESVHEGAMTWICFWFLCVRKPPPTGRWIPSTKFRYRRDLVSPFWPEHEFHQTVDLPMNYDAMKLMWYHCNAVCGYPSIYWATREKHYQPSLRWRRNGRDSVSNHEPPNCLLNRSFRRRSKKTSNSASLVFVRGIHRGPVNSPHKWPVTPKCFHLMTSSWWQRNLYHLLDYNEVVAVARPKHLLWNCTVFCWLKNDICNRHVSISLRACKNYGNSVRSNSMLISVAIAEDMVLKSRPASACRNTVSSQFWYDHLTNLNFIKKITQTSRY